MSEIKDLTKEEMVEVDRAIKSVRAKQVMTQQGPVDTAKGFTLPFKIMYTNSYNEQQLKAHIKAFNEASEALRDKCKGKDEVIDMVKFTKEMEKLMQEPAEGLVLRSINATQMMELEEDEYYKNINKDAGLQEYVSLMGRLIIDDLSDNGEDKPKKKEK